MYCPKCQKEVVVIGMGPAVASLEQVESIRRSIEEEGKLVLFNPPPFGPYHCPDCQAQLEN
ncbi:MAG: hypothetical protein JXA37_11755 [Chloroflexia bacterium]|nr:hypothetical protein [Chloroflexia bacterium]